MKALACVVFALAVATLAAQDSSKIDQTRDKYQARLSALQAAKDRRTEESDARMKALDDLWPVEEQMNLLNKKDCKTVGGKWTALTFGDTGAVSDHYCALPKEK